MADTWRQELKQRLRSAAYPGLLLGLVKFALLYNSGPSQGSITPVRCTPPHPTVIWKMPCSLACWQSDGGISSAKVPFP